MTIAALIGLFLDWTAEHRAPATCRFYQGRLQLLRTQFGEREFASLTPLEIFAHLRAAGAGQAPSTRRHNAVALERLQAFALEYGGLAQPVFRRLEKPPITSRERIPTPAETAALLRRASPHFRRLYQALRLSGARPGELCRATAADWDRTAGVIVLAAHKTARKTGRPRRIPVGAKLAELLRQALGSRMTGPLFLTPTGRPWSVPHLSRTYNRLRREARLPADLVLYLARHECGTKLTRTKGIEFARRMLGHASIATTQRYAHLDEQELAAAQDELA